MVDIYHTQTELDKSQKTEFLKKARKLDMKIQIIPVSAQY